MDTEGNKCQNREKRIELVCSSNEGRKVTKRN